MLKDYFELKKPGIIYRDEDECLFFIPEHYLYIPYRQLQLEHIKKVDLAEVDIIDIEYEKGEFTPEFIDLDEEDFLPGYLKLFLFHSEKISPFSLKKFPSDLPSKGIEECWVARNDYVNDEELNLFVGSNKPKAFEFFDLALRDTVTWNPNGIQEYYFLEKKVGDIRGFERIERGHAFPGFYYFSKGAGLRE